MPSTNNEPDSSLWEHCQSIYRRSRHPKEPLTMREKGEGELIAPFYNSNNDDGREPIAFISFTSLSDDTAYLNACYVLPEHQGKGIASYLIKQLLAKRPHVFTETGNVVAFDLYKKLGLFVRWRPYIAESTED